MHALFCFLLSLSAGPHRALPCQAADIKYSSLPYWSSYFVPLAIVLGCLYGGIWTQLTALVALVIAPLLDFVLPLDEENPTKEEEKVMESMWRFSLITWTWPVVETLVLVFTTYTIVNHSDQFSATELIGLVTSCGYVLCAFVGCCFVLHLMFVLTQLHGWSGREQRARVVAQAQRL